MNLWDKSLRLRQLFVVAVALFFFSSCEDPNSSLGFKNPNRKFNVTYVEIPIESSVLSVDSVTTDNFPLNAQGASINTFLIGQYQDNAFGKIKAESFLQFYPSSTAVVDAAAVYDSTVAYFRLNYYAYGFTGKQTLKFSIHELTDTLTTTHHYYNNSSVPYNAAQLGEAVVNVHYDSIQTQAGLAAASKDTLLAVGKLNQDFGMRLFDVIKNNPNSLLTDFKSFKYAFKGLALIPSSGDGIIGIEAGVSTASFSKVLLYYHTVGSTGALTNFARAFNYDYPSFTRYTADRSTTELSTLAQTYKSITPTSGLRYAQSGAPVVTKLDLRKFYEFADADSNKNLIINSAELIVDDVESPKGFPAHGAFYLNLMNDHDRFIDATDSVESIPVRGYYTYANQGKYLVGSEITNPVFGSFAFIGYNSDTRQYSGFMTLFAQSLFRNKKKGDAINESRIRYLAISPASPSITTSVTRTVFDAGKVKLKIYYTKPSVASNFK
jgi:hypothetical protein